MLAFGYLVAWGGFSLAAVALQGAMEAARLMSPMLESTNVWLGAAILAAPGLWQLTPIKTGCLRHCRTPGRDRRAALPQPRRACPQPGRAGPVGMA